MTEVQVKKRKKRTISNFQKTLNHVRDKHTPLHTVEFELALLSFQEWKINRLGEQLRVIRNTVLRQLCKNHQQMVRTKAYNRTLRGYRALADRLKKATETERKVLEKEKVVWIKRFEELRTDHNVTFDFARKYGAELRTSTYSLPDAVTVWSVCEMAWKSMESVLYRGAEKPHFYKKDEWVALQGKQAERCIILKRNQADGSFFASHDGMAFPLKVKPHDLFLEETLSHIAFYMDNNETVDNANVERFLVDMPIESTFRIRNNRIVRKEIRGKIRYFLQTVLEGQPVPKRKQDGSFRHVLGRGRVSIDIGTQSIALVTNDKAVLKNLAERSPCTFRDERKVVLHQRKMERSRRSMNPQNYLPDGRIKNGKKEWVVSKRYLALKQQLKEHHRKAAVNRKYAHNEDVNRLRSWGDEAVLETMNIQGLQKKAKVATRNEKTGNWNSRKRFGKSILNRSPGYFISQLKERFKATGGTVREVNTWTFKASQYDHVLDASNKKQLSQRWHTLPCGTKIQRDLYSAFLLHCSDADWQKPNNEECQTFFPIFYPLHQQCVESIKNNRVAVLNSGIN
ncbi:hypothetical protein [Planococcus donghaensis]|uniref:hypothetical protein n=1 Tax=Planococcus donghaensis TaxID=414778 RepID=UPI0037355C51